MTTCPKTKHGKQCKRGLGHSGLHVYSKLGAKKVSRVEYEKQRRYVLARNGGKCEAHIDAVCTITATQAHHLLRRSQGGTDVPGNLLAVCAQCHFYIHTYPAWAYERGFLYKANVPTVP